MNAREQVASFVGGPPRAGLLRRILSPLNVTAFAAAHFLVGLSGDEISGAIFGLFGLLQIVLVVVAAGTVITITTIVVNQFAGFTFYWAAVGPLSVERQDQRLKLALNHEWSHFPGSVSMLPGSQRFTTRQAVTYLGTGAIAGILLLVAVVGVLRAVGWMPGTGALPDSPFTLTFRYLPLALTVVAARELASGGLLLVQILRMRKRERARLLAILGLGAYLIAGRRPRDLDSQAIEEAVKLRDDSQHHAVGLSLAYIRALDSGSPETAAEYLNEITAILDRVLDDSARASLVTALEPYLPYEHERAFIAALLQRDQVAAIGHLNRARRTSAYRSTALRAGTATLIAAGDYAGARHLVLEARQFPEPLPKMREWRGIFELRLMRNLMRHEAPAAREIRQFGDGSDKPNIFDSPNVRVIPATDARAVRSVVKAFTGATLIFFFAWSALLGLLVVGGYVLALDRTYYPAGEVSRVIWSGLVDGVSTGSTPPPIEALDEGMLGMHQDEIDYLTVVFWHQERIEESIIRYAFRETVPIRQRQGLLAEASLWASMHQQLRELSPPPGFREFHNVFLASLAEYDRAGEEIIAYAHGSDFDALDRATEHADRGYALILESYDALEWTWTSYGADGTSPEIVDALLTTGDLAGDWHLQPLRDDHGIWWGPISPCSGDPAIHEMHITEIGLVRMATSGESNRSLRQMIVESDVSEATAALDRVRRSLTCERWIDAEGNLYHVLQLESPELGHDSVAYRVRVTDDDEVVLWDSHVVLTRHANVVIEIWHYDTAGEPEINDTIEIVERALRRVRESGILQDTLGLRYR